MRYTGPGRHGNDVGSIQGNYPVPKAQVVYYFELLVKEKGDKGDVSIGFADKHFKMGRAPGYAPSLRAQACAQLCCSCWEIAMPGRRACTAAEACKAAAHRIGLLIP